MKHEVKSTAKFAEICQYSRYEDVYEKLLTDLNWKRLAALTEDGLKYTEYLTAMESKLKGKNIELIVNKKFTREHDKRKQFENFRSVSFDSDFDSVLY